jgi:hypothetical protein
LWNIKLSCCWFKKDIPVKSAANKTKSKPHFNGIMGHNIKLQKISGRACDMHGKVHLWVVKSTFFDWSIGLNTKVA